MCRRCLFQIFGNVESYVCGHRHHGAIELSVAKIFTFDANILSEAWVGGYAIKRFQILALGTRTANFGVGHCDVHGLTISIRGGFLRGGDLRPCGVVRTSRWQNPPIVSVARRYLARLSKQSY